ncbi:unnamed protein product [Anisakis simplex]|uniref:CA domain-containing protein n=1 Tax=Anisakis simplex TaxID=6269 RepID=A0A0M3KFL2_ANISI|nr:unnamed protein product [Anisakis simplex]
MKLDHYLIDVVGRKIGTILTALCEVATTLVDVIVNSSEIVDLPPRFEAHDYNFAIYENAEPQTITVLHAFHPLADDDHPIVYDILDDPVNLNLKSEYFSVDSSTGELRSLQPFDYEQKQFYRFEVSACLQGNKTSCGSCKVTVSINDENDNSPQFQQPSYSVDLSIDTPVGTEVARFIATDADSGNNADISYALKTPSG